MPALTPAEVAQDTSLVAQCPEEEQKQGGVLSQHRAEG